MTRSISFFVSQVYVPAFLIVMISWVPFWLNPDHHARVALGVTTVLTMTTLMSNINEKFSSVSHLKSLDVYLFISFFTVFCSLIEYATVGHFEFQNQYRQWKKIQSKRSEWWRAPNRYILLIRGLIRQHISFQVNVLH